MHSTQHPVLRLGVVAAAAQLACVAGGVASAQTASEVAPQVTTGEGSGTVVITGKKLGMGLMVTEDAPKARSTITAEELEKQRPTGNAYEALEMLPAVNSYNHDATGLFGGGLTLRGFNSDQIGATINGVPVNDSGSFAVYPQQYVDQENTCSQFVTQGSTDVDSPQVGATGGNFGIVTCNPEDVSRVRVMQTAGQLHMLKTFVRVDSGRLADGRSKFFVSASHAEADKWKGRGGASRDHVDAGFNYDWDRFNFVHATVLWNEALNNNVNNITLSDLNSFGYGHDYAGTFKGHLAPGPGAQVESTQSPAYYRLGVNPFKNAVASATARFRLNDNLDVKILPYLWYGFGNGGAGQQRAQSESAFYDTRTGLSNGRADLNGDGDTADTVLVSSASTTKTYRPGVTASLTWTVGSHEILGGFWYERARHEQTGPMIAIADDGTNADPYLQVGRIARPDGKFAQTRDWLTVSTAYQAFLQDTVSLMDDDLKLNVGVRTPFIRRDFTNFGNEGSSSLPYRLRKTYRDILPQLGARYRLTNDDQLFASVAKNVKAPPNFVFGNVGTSVSVVDGVARLDGDVKEETSWNTDIGYRHQDSRYIASVTLFLVDFKDRQATSFDPATQASTYTNVGRATNRGIEIEVGNTPVRGWAFYASLGYNDSEIRDDMRVSATQAIPTGGKQMINTPKLKAGLSAEYQDGPFWSRLKVRSTGRQQASMINDETAPGYTTFGIDGGYTFANFAFLKRPKLQWNISNITNKQYRNPSFATVVNTSPIPGLKTTTDTQRYYLGAPRFASVTLSVDL